MLPTLEEPRRSNLIFVPCQEPGEPIRLDQLRRVRKPVSRSKSGVQGKVADVLHGCSRHAESQNELKAFQVLMATARAGAWQEQPFILEYHREGVRYRYTPDVLVIWGSASGSRRGQRGFRSRLGRESGTLHVHQRPARRAWLSFPCVEEI